MRIKKNLYAWYLLLREVPSGTVTFFFLSVVLMNLSANKSIDLGVSWLALDGGILWSWITFLSLDMVTKHFGARAANRLTVIAIGVNLFVCLLFYLLSLLPGSWSGSNGNTDSDIAVNATFRGTWFVLLGSTIAFSASSFVNNALNAGLYKLFRGKQTFGVFAVCSYLSTAVGQLIDNLLFALLVSRTFFGWSTVQCVTCAVTGMIAELLCEVLFSKFGYSICNKWKSQQVGKRYFDYCAKEKLCV